jgi:hypothetical protein
MHTQNTHLKVSKIMSRTSQIISTEPTFAIGVSGREAQTFSFITIQNPSELKNKHRQSLIRRHAKRDTDRSKAQKYRSRVELLQAPRTAVKPQQVSCERSPDQADLGRPGPGKDASRQSELDYHDNEASTESLSFLRPLGAGRGLVPFANYPFEVTSRMVQLFDYSMLLAYW